MNDSAGQLALDGTKPACPEPGCGYPKGRGRPRKGWVRVEGDFPDGSHEPRWFCSWNCVGLVAKAMAVLSKHN